MQFGVKLPSFGAFATRDAIVAVAVEAEALGYDSIWTTDHVLMPRGEEGPYGRIYELLITLSYVAALTSRVRLGTSVMVLPQREPVLVAKQVVTLDELSGGRVILGVGAGWNEREFGFLGANFPGRGKRLDEYIGVLRELWTSAEPRFDGSVVAFADAVFSPRPDQPNGPPIWIGGSSPAAIKRAARIGDAWHALGATPEEFARGMQRVRELSNGRTVEGTLKLNASLGRKLPPRAAGDGW